MENVQMQGVIRQPHGTSPYCLRYSTMTHRTALSFLAVTCLALFLAATAFPQEETEVPDAPIPEKLTLERAAMCEQIQAFAPYNEAIAFSVTIGKVSCFSFFDPVPEKTVVYHNWFKRDRLITKKKLSLQPPRWSTFSTIQLREADKGPWRVEITDEEGNIFSTLRFSITD